MHFHEEFLIKPKKLEARNILNEKKIYKDLMIYFTRYHPNESVTMLNLCYDELTRKIKNFEEKNTC